MFSQPAGAASDATQLEIGSAHRPTQPPPTGWPSSHSPASLTGRCSQQPPAIQHTSVIVHILFEPIHVNVPASSSSTSALASAEGRFPPSLRRSDCPLHASPAAQPMRTITKAIELWNIESSFAIGQNGATKQGVCHPNLRPGLSACRASSPSDSRKCETTLTFLAYLLPGGARSGCAARIAMSNERRWGSGIAMHTDRDAAYSCSVPRSIRPSRQRTSSMAARRGRVVWASRALNVMACRSAASPARSSGVKRSILL